MLNTHEHYNRAAQKPYHSRSSLHGPRELTHLLSVRNFLARRPIWWPSKRTEVKGQASGREGSRSRQRLRKASDGKSHLGSALQQRKARTFPLPPPGEGPPLRILPVGGLGEIGMNCMLIGVYDRYILVDAGLMFPDFADLGMQKILPDISFLLEWRDKIEAVIITHGHEDHIGAFPWIYPALDPSTPIYAGAFAMQLIKRRLQEYNLWDPTRFHTFQMRQKFQLGPFSCEPIRVTHSIPDCCGMILRSDFGNIVHTGDWKIDENPIDGQMFDREFFEAVDVKRNLLQRGNPRKGQHEKEGQRSNLKIWNVRANAGKEEIALLMSDSTNVLSPGRTTSESDVREALTNRILGHAGKGRIITTQFASNVHRLASVKKAADIAGRKVCFIGMSLTSYSEAAQQMGSAPFDLQDLVAPSEIDSIDPNELLIVTTGSQGEARAALSLASRGASPLLRLLPDDLLLYSAKVIPGNDTAVMRMMNRVAALGPRIAMGRAENLHTSGHAYQEELRELIQLVKPQHFLPVHGEYAFLCAHAELAHEAGVAHTSVIRNGQMLGVAEQRNGRSYGRSQGMQLLGRAPLRLFYNDGHKGTGTYSEMAIEERTKLASDGLVVAAVEVDRGRSSQPTASGRPDSKGDPSPTRAPLRGHVKITSRALWLDQGRLLEELHKAAGLSIQRLPSDAHLAAVENLVAAAIKRECRAFNRKDPEVIVIAHESSSAAIPADSSRSRSSTRLPSTARSRRGPGPATPLPKEFMQQRRQANPRENPGSSDEDVEYG